MARLGQGPVDTGRADLEHVRSRAEDRVGGRLIEHRRDRLTDLRHVVEADAAVFVDQHPHLGTATLAGHHDVLEVEPGLFDHIGSAARPTRGLAEALDIADLLVTSAVVRTTGLQRSRIGATCWVAQDVVRKLSRALRVRHWKEAVRNVTSLTRRSALRLLALAAVSAVAGCRSGKQQAAPAGPATGVTPTTRPPASATATSTRTTTAPAIASARPSATAPAAVTATADPTAQAAATSERALISAYDNAMRAHPDLATALGALRADHVGHLKALDAEAVVSPAPVPALPAVPSSVGSPIAPASPAASPSTAAVVATLTDLETRAAAARLDDMATATGSLAALLASIGGCEAAHAATLAIVVGSA